MKKIEVDRNVKALIFDCDGTLADTMPTHMKAWERSLSDFHGLFKEPFFDSLKGMADEDIMVEYNKRFHTALDPRQVAQRKADYVLQELPGIQPVKPVVDVFYRYQGVLPMAVVSGGRRNLVLRTLEAIRLGRSFDVILTADDPFAPKPAPDIFFEAARRLGVAPSLCQVFEDGDVGLNAARAAGMVTTDIRLFL
ncbi:MAG: HAD family hydrolase [Candidatus Zhuqueibacterota bacterium]